MPIFVILENPRAWSLTLPGVEVVAAQDYLVQPRYYEARRAKVFNLCRTYSHQTVGYYVSLLAAARGHKPLPSVSTLQDLRHAPLIRIVGDDLEADLQRAFRDLKSDRFTLSIYFGRNLARRYDRIARILFNQFPAPFLRVEFVRRERWRLDSLRPIAADEIPENHHAFVIEQAQRHFQRPRARSPAAPQRFDMGILHDPGEVDAPSDERAIQKFVAAARRQGIAAWVVEREEYGRIAEYDALFIRQTTAVDHPTYRFARRAAAEGLVVIDDPESIVRCTNKVFLAEVFARQRIPCPRTWVVHEETAPRVVAEVSFPCVVKKPDSSFSAGVYKADDPDALRRHLADVFEESELALIQQFIPSDFDWRIGLIDGRPLYACRYYMAKGDWRIQTAEASGRRRYGKVETVPIEHAPVDIVELARRATIPIGNGLYGVDVKESGGRLYVMEVNDNPSVEAGVEDAVLKDELYDAIMRVFLGRLEARVTRTA